MDNAWQTLGEIELDEASFATVYAPKQSIQPSQDVHAYKIVPADRLDAPASIIRRRLHEDIGQITLNTDQHGNVFHFNLLEKGLSTNAGVRVRLTPPTPGLLPKVTAESAQEMKKKEEQHKEEGSFFSRYWHVIIPIMVFLLLTGSGPEEEKKATK